jgi:hypothetical protein
MDRGEAQVTSNGYDSRIAAIQPNTVCRHFLLLLTLAGCDVYSGDGGGYDYGRGPAYYDGGISTGYAPYYQHNRQDRRWQDQGASEQRRHNPQPAYVTPPPSATQNRKALENLGFRPDR